MRRVLITGGGTGIGRAIALAFAKNGDVVTVAGRREAPLREVSDEHENIDWTLVDVTREAEMAALFDRPYDVVVANAGSGTAAKVKETPLELWEQTIAVNLTGTFLTFRAALQTLGPGGRLIAIASTQALKGGANIAAYSASKHGVLGLVRSLAHEVVRQGATCNAICPGFTQTDLADQAVTGLMARYGIDRGAAEQKVVAQNPMGRMITPEEVAATALFLASEGAASINGHALSVSGGEI